MILSLGASIAGTMYSLEDLKIPRKAKVRCSYTNVVSQSNPHSIIARTLSPSVHCVDGGVTSVKLSLRQEKKIHQFLMALCLCHSAQVKYKLKEDLHRKLGIFILPIVSD